MRPRAGLGAPVVHDHAGDCVCEQPPPPLTTFVQNKGPTPIQPNGDRPVAPRFLLPTAGDSPEFRYPSPHSVPLALGGGVVTPAKCFQSSFARRG